MRKYKIIIFILLFFTFSAIIFTSIDLIQAVQEKNELHIFGNGSYLALIFSIITYVYIDLK